MLGRIARRLRATFTGPSVPDLLAEVRGLRARLDALEEWRAGCLVEPFHTRPGTLDAAIAAEVLRANEYRLPAAFAPEDAVLDVGGHVGSFAAACLLRGAGRVAVYEPFPANHRMIEVNLARFGPRAAAHLAAVWRSDGGGPPPRYLPSDDPANSGGGTVVLGEGGGDEVAAVSLDDAVRRLLGDGPGRLRLLKLDCEGSEYPVLLTATCLGRVEEICGEYHHVPNPSLAARVGGATSYSVETLVRHLTAAGFAVEAEANPRNPTAGIFWARRPAGA